MPRCYIVKKQPSTIQTTHSTQQKSRQHSQPYSTHHFVLKKSNVVTEKNKWESESESGINEISSSKDFINPHNSNIVKSEWNKTVQKPHSILKRNKDNSPGPVSPTEACVAPIYYNNVLENRTGKSFYLIFKLFHMCL